MSGITQSKAQMQHLYVIQQDSFAPVGPHVSDTDISGVVTLVPPAGATKLLIQAQDQNVRYTVDGSLPSASLGFVISADDPPGIIYLGMGLTVRIIEETATASIQYLWGY